MQHFQGGLAETSLELKAATSEMVPSHVLEEDNDKRKMENKWIRTHKWPLSTQGFFANLLCQRPHPYASGDPGILKPEGEQVPPEVGHSKLLA
jgi:hypothetical protein